MQFKISNLAKQVEFKLNKLLVIQPLFCFNISKNSKDSTTI